MSDLISVIVTVFNVEEYLDECLKSILKQTYKKLEIIIVNDGSKDNSKSICEKFANMDSRIIVINQNNKGSSNARNTGLEHAHGKYITFVDGDDYLDISLYEKMHNACVEEKSRIAVCNIIGFIDGEKPKIHRGAIKQNYTTQDMENIFGNALRNSQSVCNKLFLHSLFKKINFPDDRMSEDGYVVYDLLFRARRVSYLSINGYFYRRHLGSNTIGKYVSHDSDFVICNVRTYIRVKRKYPDLWEAGLERVINSGFINILQKIVNLSLIDMHKEHASINMIRKNLLLVFPDLVRTKKIDTIKKVYVLLFLVNPYFLYIFLKASNKIIC